MPNVRIDSLDDPRLEPYRDLPHADPKRFSDLFVVEGRLLTERLVNSAYDVQSVLLDERYPDLMPQGLAEEVPVYLAAADLLDGIIGFHFHRGVLACGYRKSGMTLTEAVRPVGDAVTLVVCVGVQDPINLGGILRNCIAFGVDTVVLAAPCADPFSRRVSRVSMGAVFKLTLVTSEDLATDLKYLRDTHEFELAATVLSEEAEKLETARRASRLALLFGNEGYGLDEGIVQMCQRQITIPMSHGTDSLNAAVASGVFLYHFQRITPL